VVKISKLTNLSKRERQKVHSSMVLSAYIHKYHTRAEMVKSSKRSSLLVT